MHRGTYSVLLLLLAAATVRTQTPTNSGRQSLSFDPHDLEIWSSGKKLTKEQVASAEATFTTSPDDPSAHLKLSAYYCPKFETTTCATHLFWLVDHLPESFLFFMPSLFLWNNRDVPVGLIHEWQDHWKRAVAAHPDNPVVLDHAASNLRYDDPSLGQALALLRKAVEGNPACNYPEATACRTRLGGMYASVLISFERDTQCAVRTPDEERLFTSLRNELKSINEPLILFSASALLKGYSHAPKCGTDVEQNNQLGLELFNRAMAALVGMTEEEAIRNFGAPSETTTSGREKLFKYSKTLGMVFTVVLQEGKVVELR